MIKKNSSIFLFVLILYSIFCSIQLGVTWDTFFYYELGKDRLDYLLSLGNDDSFKRVPHSKYLPGAYSTISAFFVQFFPKKYLVESLYFINLLFSFLSLVGIYKISKELFNKEIGRITFLLCFFNPIFFGHMSMNHNDNVLAFSNIWFFYLLLKYFKNQNDPPYRNKYVILSGLSLGLGLGVRSSFIITTLPFFIFIFIDYIFSKSLFSKKFSNKKFYLDSLKVLGIAYFFMILFWPQTHENIFTKPFLLALEGLSYGFGVPFIMINGEIFLTQEFPKNYILINLLYKLPEIIILSYIIFIFLFFKISKYFNNDFKSFNNKIFLLVLIITLPNIFLFLSPYSPYDGLRFFLYLIPYISIIPSILIFFLIKNLKYHIYKTLSVTILIFFILNIVNFFYLTPFHYVYLNLLAGKNSNHSSKFENDYWGVSSKKLIAKIKNSKIIKNRSLLRFATCGIEEKAQVEYLKKMKNLNFKMVSKSDDYDFILMNNRIIFDQDVNSNKIETCFERFSGNDIINISVRGLVISKIVKAER
ncbi:MAG: hypothetical protein CMG67_01225 [Candidatus Marinimicrobia bacterium]|nr:hypothetical protein [Candidatus Neomarinimicrobiota bacterium]|tara:strand:- start:16940 stop:18532 length:1593 start_codon:yes stop_codon:yes gene_type:complete